MPTLFRRSAARRADVDRAATLLYGAIVGQARLPPFYSALGVPDSLDGRYDMIVLHAFLVLRRLGAERGTDRQRAGRAAQALFDLFMADMDQNLREMGVGDLGVGHRVKAMAKAFYGRAAAYEAAFATDDVALDAALRRNLFGTVAKTDVAPSAEMVRAIGRYMRRCAERLAGQTLDDLLAGDVAFADPPGSSVPK